jgi:hypothetical protein
MVRFRVLEQEKSNRKDFELTVSIEWTRQRRHEIRIRFLGPSSAASAPRYCPSQRQGRQSLLFGTERRRLGVPDTGRTQSTCAPSPNILHPYPGRIRFRPDCPSVLCLHPSRTKSLHACAHTHDVYSMMCGGDDLCSIL